MSFRAFTRSANDQELADVLAGFVSGMAGPAPPSGAGPGWCFLEGPTRSEFIMPMALDPASLETLWLVRVFGAAGELAARRRDFDSPHRWLVRVIAPQCPGSGWAEHVLQAATQDRLVLFGESEDDGRFREGSQFRTPFDYPGLACNPCDRAVLVVQKYGVGQGPEVVRWVALEPLKQQSGTAEGQP